MSGLEVHADRMLQNLNVTRGLIQAEAVMLALGAHMGRLPAHELVERASRLAVSSNLPLLEVLSRDVAVTDYLSPAKLAELLSPLNYCGQSTGYVDAVLAKYHGRSSGPDAGGEAPNDREEDHGRA